MDDQQTLSLEAAASLSIPARTIAAVHVRSVDGEPAVAAGIDSKGRWLRIDFEVVDGPHVSEKAALTIPFDASDGDFRRAVEVITGVKVRAGLMLTMAEVLHALSEHSFLAELGQLSRGQQTGAATVLRLLERRSPAGTRRSCEQPAPKHFELTAGARPA